MEFKEFILNKNIEIKKFKNYLTITKDDFYYLKEILEESWS